MFIAVKMRASYDAQLHAACTANTFYPHNHEHGARTAIVGVRDALCARPVYAKCARCAHHHFSSRARYLREIKDQ